MLVFALTPIGVAEVNHIAMLNILERATKNLVKTTVVSTIDENGWLVDNIDYAFKKDAQAIGTWTSVDFVPTIKQFDPSRQFFNEELYLKTLTFDPNGYTNFEGFTWTKDLVLAIGGQKVANRYSVVEIGGSKYMFLEWKSGDYTFRHETPQFYVLKKQLH